MGDSRGKCFFDPSFLKILLSNSRIFFHTLLTTERSTNAEKHRKIVGSVFEKISLENCKISNFAYSLAGRFLKQFSSVNLNNFQRINLLKLYTFVNDDTPTFGKKLGKSDMGFLREGCMGSKKITPSYPPSSSLSPYKQIIVVNSATKFTDKQHIVCAHTLCSNLRHVQIQ